MSLHTLRRYSQTASNLRVDQDNHALTIHHLTAPGADSKIAEFLVGLPSFRHIDGGRDDLDDSPTLIHHRMLNTPDVLTLAILHH